MWRMLCSVTREKGADVWQLRFSDVQADESGGRAHWDAHYRFSATGRIVDNSIDAQFGFGPDGRIVRHRDSFDFWRWSRQALGPPGWLLGWTPMLRAKLRAKAIARATISLTAPCCSTSAASTPSDSIFASLEYVTKPRSNQSLEPESSVHAAAIMPPVQLSAVASFQWFSRINRARRSMRLTTTSRPR